MEHLTSRKNAYITHLRSLGSDGSYRRERGEYLVDGLKLLREALQFSAAVTSVLWKGSAQSVEGLVCPAQYTAPAELFDYASPMKNSPGPLFTVAMPAQTLSAHARHVLVLENVQDPGNVGTVIRSANAFGTDSVLLVGDCADLYHPKTVRATMGAIFREHVVALSREELMDYLRFEDLPLYGAALSDKAVDIRSLDLSRCAVAIGSEGRGLSREFLSGCDGELIIPMNPQSESLNAAIAASLVMWEMARGD